MNTVKFLIKVNDFGKADMDKLKRYVYNTMSLFHLNQVDKIRLDGEAKSLDIDNMREFTADYESDITLIYYNTVEMYAKKAELKYGFVASVKSILFNDEIEEHLMSGLSVGLNDFIFNTLKSIIDLSKEESDIPQLGDRVEISLLCDDEDILDWCYNQDTTDFVVSDIDYLSGRIYIDKCEYSIDINDVVKIAL